MTRNETLCCVHEPFGDAFYYGPERLSSRFAEDEAARVKSGFNNSTYQTIFDNIDNLRSEVRLLPPIFCADDISCFLSLFYEQVTRCHCALPRMNP
jgi:hypothetical protein